MPDQFGRLSFQELRDYVLRNLASFGPAAVDQITGKESGIPVRGLNVQFTQDNISLRINSSTTKTALLINANNETVFAREVFFDAVPGVLQYKVPPDLLQMRSLWWLIPGSALPFSPENYVPMSYQDQMQDGGEVDGVNFSRPTWRFVGNVIQLNQDPGDFLSGIQQQGLWVKYIRWVKFLVADSDYLDLPFAQVAQEVIAWDATLDILNAQEEIVDSAAVKATLDYWNQQLEIAVRNQVRPPEIRLIGPSLIKNTFIGR